MLLQLSQFSPFAPPLPQAIPTQLFMSMGYARMFFSYSIPSDVPTY